MAVSAQDYLSPILPRDLEVDIAKSALPEYLRDDASVYILKRGEGFVQAIKGSNGYTCFVERLPGNQETIIPIAFDAEGTRVMVPAMFDKMKYVENGMTPQQAQAKVAAGFKSGKYLPPAIGGISYMLSPLNIVPKPGGGTFRYYPHFMIYSPYVTNQSIGVAKPDLEGYLPFVNSTGPHAKIVIPLGEKERADVERRHADLIERFERFVKSSGQ